MLKLTYLESGLYLELLSESVEDWLALRVVFALRMGDRLVAERTTASLLLPIDLFQRSSLEKLVRQEEGVWSAQGDADHIEVSLTGTWIASDEEDSEGIFVTTLNPVLESLLFQIWQASQVRASSVSH